MGEAPLVLPDDIKYIFLSPFHAAYVEKFRKLPIKGDKQIVVSKVDERICEREIWIPWREIKVNVGKIIDRSNRKNQPEIDTTA